MNVVNLAVQTVINPAVVARQLLDIRLGREVLWLAFFLAVVLSCLVQVGRLQFLPLQEGELAPVSESVGLYLIRSAALLLLSILAFLFAGRLLGGVATFDGIMTLIVWLQYLQIVAMLITLVLAMVLPFLMLMFSLATFVLSLYVTLHFLDEAHKFGSLWKAFGVILLAGVVAVPFVLALMPNAPV